MLRFLHCLILLSVSNVMTWSFILLLCAGDIQPNPGPLSVLSSSDQSSSSNDIFSQLTLNHHLSFVQYNVQSIVNKLDIIQTELFEIDILSFTGFILGDSTVNQLTYLYHTFCEALDAEKEVRAVFCDISKAFDGTKDSYTNLKLLVSQEKLYLGLKIIYLIGDNV